MSARLAASRGVEHIHLNRSAVGEFGALDIKALAGVAVGVDAVAARGRRRGAASATVGVVPGAVEYTGVGGGAGGAGPGQEVEDSGGEVEPAVGASGTLRDLR